MTVIHVHRYKIQFKPLEIMTNYYKKKISQEHLNLILKNPLKGKNYTEEKLKQLSLQLKHFNSWLETGTFYPLKRHL